MTETLSPEIPFPSKEDIVHRLTKSEAINLRVTPEEKETIKGAASTLGLTVTDYLVRLGMVTAGKIVSPDLPASPVAKLEMASAPPPPSRQ